MKKLTQTEAEIIIGLKGVVRQATLAEHYGITKRQVQRIQSGENWAHLQETMI